MGPGAGLELGSTVATHAESQRAAERHPQVTMRRRPGVSTQPSLSDSCGQATSALLAGLPPLRPRVSRTLRIATPPTIKNTT